MPHDLNSAVPPIAPAVPTHRELHGQAWIDEYAWMREHRSPQFTAYLRAERGYYETATSHLAHLSDTLFGEMEHRLIPTDDSVSWRRGDCFYYTRTVTGSEYEQFMSSRDRRQPGRVVLDPAELAAKLGNSAGFVELGVREVSPDGRLLAYSVDTRGDEVYALRFRDLSPQRDLNVDDDLDEVVPRSYYGGAWSADSGTFFYTVHDELFRPYQVWRHRIGTPVSADALVHTEPDARFEVTVRTTRSGGYILIESACRDTTETWYIPAAHPTAAPALFTGRRTGVEYRIDHAADRPGSSGGYFYLVTNDGAGEFRLMRAPVPATGPDRWSEVAAARPGERLHACHALENHLVVELRRDGFPLLRVIDRATIEPDGQARHGSGEREILAEIPAGRITLDTPFEYRSASVTVRIDSLIEPPRWHEVDLTTGARRLRKARVVPGYDPGAYRTQRRHAPAPDGTPVPVTLAWRADTPLDGTAPALLWGYGAYESCDDPEFDEALPSLLDRGVVYALTHPRGGGENGRGWWLGGRLADKANTFTDHLAVADWLAGAAPGRDALVDGSRIATRGLSAGGLLQGAVLSMRPERWRVVVAEVPFVDVITSMLDPDTPLTVNEWDEWGDPRRADAFAWMRAYSPYDNPPAGGRRPALLVTGAVHDPRVMVHEPAKWVARLRATSTSGDGPVLLRVELGAGAHTGPSGRYAHYRYEAEVYAFLLDQLGAGTRAR